MERRYFLRSGLAVAGLALFAPRALATAMADMGDEHAGHDMGAMSATPLEQVVTTALLPTSVLPSGQPLQRLPVSARGSAIHLAAAPIGVSFTSGKVTQVWAYNGSTPGPLIEAMEGDTVEIHFRNDLPQATTVHWHGLPVPADQDGGPHAPVPAGGERIYRLALPKGSAGTYWYHPHPHDDTPEQVFRGLAGAFIVRAVDDPIAHIPEQHLFITDLKLAADASIAPNSVDDWMDGREGQFVLINGQHQPHISVAGTQRWRIWNACSARYLRLKLDGGAMQWVGTDGGLLEAPRIVTELLLAPAQRAEIIVNGKGEGRLLALAYDRQKMGAGSAEADRLLAHVSFVPGKTVAVPKSLRHIADLGPAKASKRVVFSETMSMANGRHEMAFLINGKAFDMQRMDWQSRVNEVELWEVINDSHMDHPFHLHGTQFQVVERTHTGKTNAEPFHAWRDTVNLHPGETLKLKLRFMHRGVYMAHCHIIEHEAQGMMAQVQVV